MIQVHSDKSIPRHPPSSTTVYPANTSRNNIQHDILTSSVAAKGPPDGTSSGEGTRPPDQERRSSRQRRPFRRQNGHTRRRFSAQERLGVAAVRKVGACAACRRKKTKCRHTVRPFGLASDSSVTSIFTSSHHSPAVGYKSSRHSPTFELYPPLVQALNPSTTRPPRVEILGPLLQSTDLQPAGHIHETASLAQYMNELVAFSLVPDFEDQNATSSWESRPTLITETLHNTNHCFPLNSLTDHALDGGEDFFAMERIIRPSVAEHWTQPPIAWPAEAESHFRYTQLLSHHQVSCTGSQLYFNLDYTFPPQGSFSPADSVAYTAQWNGCAARHAWIDFEKEEFMDGYPLQFPHQCQE
ncbi:hypothetical protein V8E51_013101 [Hyaloscypha variabilis]